MNLIVHRSRGKAILIGIASLLWLVSIPLMASMGIQAFWRHLVGIAIFGIAGFSLPEMPVRDFTSRQSALSLAALCGGLATDAWNIHQSRSGETQSAFSDWGWELAPFVVAALLYFGGIQLLRLLHAKPDPKWLE